MRPATGPVGGAAATVRMARRCLPADARRPASWMGGGAAVGACWWLTHSGPPTLAEPPWGLALVAGAGAALAAIGDAPGATVRPRPDPRLLAAVTLARGAWPVVAGALTAPLVGLTGAVAAVFVGVMVVTMATTVALRRSGGDAAEAGSATLLAAVAAGAAATVVPRLAVPAAATAWAAFVLVAVAWTRRGVRPGDWSATEGMEAIGWPAASGRLGGALVAVSMVAALLGMTGWLFLVPDQAALFGGLAAACFVALAVPRATLAWGAIGAGRRRRLLATTAGPPAGAAGLGRRLDRILGVGFLGPEWRVPVSAAAILGWPPLVAAGVVGGAEALDRVGLVAALAVAGGGLALGTALLLRAGASRETAQAVALTVVLTLTLAVRGGAPGQERSENRPNDGRTGVEESGASCETPQPHRLPTGAERPFFNIRHLAHSLTRGVHPCEEP